MKKSALILGVLLFAVTLLPTPVLAAGVWNQTELTPKVGENTTLEQSAIAWYAGCQWVIIGWNGAGVASAANTVNTATLFYAKDNTVKPVSIFHASSNQYGGSTLKDEMAEFFEDWGARETAAIEPRTLTGGSGDYNTQSYNPDHIAGVAADNQFLWPLSVKEAKSLHSTIHVYSSGVVVGYWLRSPGGSDDNVAVVSDGQVYSGGNMVGIGGSAVRPAFILNLSSVLFTSAAAGGKNPDVGTLSPIDAAPGTPVKFTMLDNALTLGGVGLAGGDGTGTLAFAYDPATAAADTGKYISCVLEQGGAVKYYGKLEDLENDPASGTVSVPLSGVRDGTYTLKIFSEQDNGDNLTDYAGTPSVWTLKVSGGTGTIVNTSGAGSGGGCDSMDAGAGMAGMLLLISALWSARKTQKTRNVKK